MKPYEFTENDIKRTSIAFIRKHYLPYFYLINLPHEELVDCNSCYCKESLDVGVSYYKTEKKFRINISYFVTDNFDNLESIEQIDRRKEKTYTINDEIDDIVEAAKIVNNIFKIYHDHRLQGMYRHDFIYALCWKTTAYLNKRAWREEVEISHTFSSILTRLRSELLLEDKRVHLDDPKVLDEINDQSNRKFSGEHIIQKKDILSY